MIKETEFLKTLTEIFRTELDDERLHLEMSSTQSDIVDWDSLAHVRIVMRVEGAYGVQFEVEEIEEMDSVQDFFDAIVHHLG